MEHSLVKYEYQVGSKPQYRHYVECFCGFQARMGTEQAVKSQFNAHLAYHGVEPMKFDKPEEKVEEKGKNGVDVKNNPIPDWMKTNSQVKSS